MAVLGDAAPGRRVDKAQEASLFQSRQLVGDLPFGEVGDGVAIRRLVTRGREGVDAERVVLRRRERLLHQRAQHPRVHRGQLQARVVVEIHALILAQVSRRRGDTVSPMQITPLTGTFGADVRGIDFREDARADTIEAVRVALDEHLVLAVRDQRLGIDEFEEIYYNI